MGAISQIQWTDATWNIAVGCRKVDGDCKFCYMYRDSLTGTRYDPKQVRKTKTVFNLPKKYKEKNSKVWDGPPLLFTSSLTDFALPEIDPFRHEMWEIIRSNPHITFQLLTKRPERLPEILPSDWGVGWQNVWLGTSVGHAEGMVRIEHLLKVPARVRFVSFEPLWAGIELKNYSYDWSQIHWAIIGGESGNDKGQYRYRECQIDWIVEMVDFLKPNTAIFVKQLGTHLSKELKLKDRHGGIMEEWPAKLQIREFPKVQVKF